MNRTRVENKDLRLVSNALGDLRDRISPAVHGGRFLTPSEAIALMDELLTLREHSRAIENELSACRWNEAKRIDDADACAAAKLQAITESSPNVLLFPVIAREHNGDGGA